MRRLRAVRASILSARFSLSAVSSSTELEAVFTSTPSFFRRSMTSWLEMFRSLARLKTLTLTIRLPSLARLVARARRRFALGGPDGRDGNLGFAGRFGRGRRLSLGLRGLLGGQPLRLHSFRLLPLRLHALRLHPLRLRRRVARVPFRLGRGGGFADLLRGLGPDPLQG